MTTPDTAEVLRLAQNMAIFRSLYIKSANQTLPAKLNWRLLVLVHNYADGKGIQPMRAAEYFRSSRAYISKSARALEQAGLVSRQANPADGRAYFLVCTVKGAEAVSGMMEQYMASTRFLFERLGPHKSLAFSTLLEEASAILESCAD